MIDFGIIAAGDGNRIKEEGSLVAKPLVEIDGSPMIGRLISIMEECGAKSVSVIVNSDMPEVWEYLQRLLPTVSCELKMVSKKTPSSMHSFYELLQIMKPEDKFIVTTVDTIFKASDFKKYAQHFANCPKDVDGLMGVTSYIDDEKPLYVETAGDKIIAYRDEATTDDGSLIEYVSAGIYGLRTNALPILQQCVAEGVNRMRNFQRSLVKGGLRLNSFDLGKVVDVDHLSDTEKANAFLSHPNA